MNEDVHSVHLYAKDSVVPSIFLEYEGVLFEPVLSLLMVKVDNIDRFKKYEPFFRDVYKVSIIQREYGGREFLNEIPYAVEFKEVDAIKKELVFCVVDS